MEAAKKTAEKDVEAFKLKEKQYEEKVKEVEKQKEKEKKLIEERAKAEAELIVVRQTLQALEKKTEHIRFPNWFTHVSSFHMVETRFSKEFLEKFMRDTSNCLSTANCKHSLKMAKIISVKRVENENLWSMYQTTRGTIQNIIGTANVPDLCQHTPQPLMPSAKDLDPKVNEFYL